MDDSRKCGENLEEIFEINKEVGVQIWSATQEHLEGQAIKEFDLFVNETRQKNEPSKKALEVTPYQYQAVETSPSTSSLVSQNVDLDVKTYQNQSELEYECDSISAGGSEYQPSDGECSDSDYYPEIVIDKINCKKKVSTKKTKKSLNKKKSKDKLIGKVRDDALIKNYKHRINKYYKRLEKEALKSDLTDSEPIACDQVLKHGLKVPYDLWNRLYSYQKDGLKWLWDLHQKSVGGLLGDEMGLGKTVQIIVFLHCLQYSRTISRHCRFIGVGSSIIVCPATVIHQWVKHFHEWSPEFRVAVLHQSGTHQGNKAHLIKDINLNKGILITTYMGILKYKGMLIEYNWHYLILDEGHKIRNPTAKITVAVKKIRTPHRIMLTGSPMQNNLTELWSLFDFTNPGMLGELNTFHEHFVNPILQGGLINASSMQEATALSVATTLKNVISPYLLRRSKAEVKKHINLPHKSEQVLFCALTKEQRDMYKDYLMGEQVNTILGRGFKDWRSRNFVRASMLMSITALRKICNHPDLYIYDEEPQQDFITNEEDMFGYYKRSGKMVVVSALLKIWKKQGQRVLLFSQGRGMIKVFQHFLTQQNYKYLKMDGSTSVAIRQTLIDTFNNDENYFVFLLTTRVGGIGVNLTGANRVIIYDPDWNPATDTQARERSWRIGQQRSVTIYRLISAGTIEEKMYQRQVWKQLLSNKVLIDPNTNKFFKNSDLHDLFSLPPDDADPEKSNIFHDYRVKIQENIEAKARAKKEKKNKKSIPTSSESNENTEISAFSEDRVEKMRELAKKIAKSMNGTQKNAAENDKKPKKSGYQLELEEQRREKLKEKEKLKHFTAPELIEYNRKKTQTTTQDDNLNLVDGKETSACFESVLNYTSKTADLYHKIIEKNRHTSSESKNTCKRSCDSAISEEEPGNKKLKNISCDTVVYKSVNTSSSDTLENSDVCDENNIADLMKSDSIVLVNEYGNSEAKDTDNNSELNDANKSQGAIRVEQVRDEEITKIKARTSSISNLKFRKIKMKPPDEDENQDSITKKCSHQDKIVITNKKHFDKSKKRKEKVDTTGKINGERVEGLVKREVKKIKSKHAERESERNDSFILQHLFSKGVSSAVEHESVIGGKSNKHSFKVREEAERKAAKALEALKKKSNRF